MAARSPAFERRARGDVHVHAHLDGDDAGEAGLAEARRAGQQQMVGRLPAHLGRLEHDGQVLFQLALADELAQPPRAKTRLVGLFDVVGGRRIEELLTHVEPPGAAGHRARAFGRIGLGELAHRLTDLFRRVAETGLPPRTSPNRPAAPESSTDRASAD